DSLIGTGSPFPPGGGSSPGRLVGGHRLRTSRLDPSNDQGVRSYFW
ncbi:unnamed protein product, partial [Musa hybrid cultivar]